MFDKSSLNGSPHRTDLVGTVNDRAEKVDTYVRNIDNLWSIGSKPFPKRSTTLSDSAFSDSCDALQTFVPFTNTGQRPPEGAVGRCPAALAP
jgi:hypothetical protein